MLMRYALIIISVLVIESTAAALVDGNFEVNTATGRIQDGYGRERLFHGLNVVVKGPPWHPGLEVFDHQFSFCDRDVELIKSWGMNVVRLAVMWPGVEPREGWINATYLQTMRSIVRKLNSAGIYTLIEFHQDLFTSQFCGDGLPSWILRHTHNISSLSKLVQKSSESHSLLQRRELSLQLGSETARNLRLQSELRKHESSWVDYVASFPEPLGLRWFTDPDEATQSQLDANCNRFDWFWYYMSFAVSKSFQDLYENQWGWADRMAEYWKVVAKAFRNEAGVLGYELLNEPWAGNFYRNPLLLLPGVADKINLAPFYEKLQAAVRSQDNKRIVFFESLTFDNVRSGFSTVPGGEKYKNKTVLSYHYYRPPNFSPQQIIRETVKEGQKLGCGTMLTEFFVNTGGSNDEFLDNNSNMFLGDPLMNLCHEQMASSSDEGNASSVVYVEERGNLQEICQSMEIIRRKMVSRMIGNKESVEDVLAAADEHVQSWIGWEYKPFVSKTGSDIQDSVFNVTGEVNLEVAKKLARTYPQAVFGRITSFSFDPSTADFSLIYHVEGRRSADRAVAGAADASANSMPSTQIFVHRAFHYASGIDIRVSHSCLHVKEFQNMILIDHSDPCHGKLVEIRISRKGTGNPI